MLAAKLSHALLPENFSVRNVGTNEISQAAERINAISVHRRRAARAIAMTFFVNGAHFGEPQIPAAIGIEREQTLVSVARAHDEKFSRDDGGAGITFARILVKPNPLRPVSGPRLEQSRFFRHVAPVWSAELRPVRATRSGTDKGHESHNEEGGKSHSIFHKGNVVLMMLLTRTRVETLNQIRHKVAQAGGRYQSFTLIDQQEPPEA
jgi:hypothetical protein